MAGRHRAIVSTAKYGSAISVDAEELCIYISCFCKTAAANKSIFLFVWLE